MQAVGQRVAGELLEQGRDHALLLRALKPDPEAPDTVFLRFPFVTRGPGDHIFPALVVDDWGREIRSLRMYYWVREEGDRFPRSEIFGYERDGRETQVFLREMELLARLPCYAYAAAEAGVTEGTLVDTILIPDANVTAPTPIPRPAELKLPLSAARVDWYAVPAALPAAEIDLERLSRSTHRGP